MRAANVKPSSGGSKGSKVKSIGSSRGVERRRLESTSSEVLSVEASRPGTSRHPHGEAGEAGSADAEETVPKGRPIRGGGDGMSEVRPENGRRKESKRLHRYDRSAEAERSAVNGTLDRRAEGFRSPSETVAARDVDERR